MATTQKQEQQAQQGSSKPMMRKPVFTKVYQLKPGTSGHTLIANVLSSNTVLHKGRAAPQNLRHTCIAECLIGDETGTIIFTARNDQGLFFKIPNPTSFCIILFVELLALIVLFLNLCAVNLIVWIIVSVYFLRKQGKWRKWKKQKSHFPLFLFPKIEMIDMFVPNNLCQIEYNVFFNEKTNEKT